MHVCIYVFIYVHIYIYIYIYIYIKPLEPLEVNPLSYIYIYLASNLLMSSDQLPYCSILTIIATSLKNNFDLHSKKQT